MRSITRHRTIGLEHWHRVDTSVRRIAKEKRDYRVDEGFYLRFGERSRDHGEGSSVSPVPDHDNGKVGFLAKAKVVVKL